MKFKIRATAPFACWTTPSLRSERTSAPVGSHSAWRGTLEGVLSKWAMRFVIHEVELLSVPRWLPVAANEMKFNSVGLNPIYVEDQHTPRTTVYLRDVDCLVTAGIVLTSKARPGEDTLPKFEEMFLRRMEKGQQRRSIYLGIRQCVAELELVNDRSEAPPRVDYSSNMGLSFFDTDWNDPEAPNYYYPLSIEHGLVRYPTWDEVREYGIKRVMRRAS